MAFLVLTNPDMRALVDEKGANCVSLIDSRLSASVLRPLIEGETPENPFLHGSPVLMPQNRIEGGAFDYGGRRYTFPLNEPTTNCHIHGEVYDKTFRVVEKGDTYCVLSLFLPAREGFLHDREVVIRYDLTPFSLRRTATVKNLSVLDMPLSFGYHTTFNVPFCDGSDKESVFLSASVGAEIKRDSRFLPTGKHGFGSVEKSINAGTFPALSRKISKHYRAINDTVTLTDTRRRVKVEYVCDEKLPYRLFYNGNADEFICLEPISCRVNCYGEKGRDETGFLTVPARGKVKFTDEIIVKEY